MSKTALQRLVDARAWLDDREHWTTGAFCRDVSGEPIGWDKPDEVASACLQGALVMQLDGPRDAPPSHTDASALICEAIPCAKGEAYKWNDGATHAEALAALDRAIDLARVKEGSTP